MLFSGDEILSANFTRYVFSILSWRKDGFVQIIGIVQMVRHFNKAVEIPSTPYASLSSIEVRRDGVKMLLNSHNDFKWLSLLILSHIKRKSFKILWRGGWV